MTSKRDEPTIVDARTYCTACARPVPECVCVPEVEVRRLVQDVNESGLRDGKD